MSEGVHECEVHFCELGKHRICIEGPGGTGSCGDDCSGCLWLQDDFLAFAIRCSHCDQVKMTCDHDFRTTDKCAEETCPFVKAAVDLHRRII